MQPKISMVIPCYNKVTSISGMFDSILAQKWDHIELVLVNDGSTDSTREIMAEYELKFRKRGFEVVIIDQKNMGVAGAVREGFRHVSGDYVCQVDADDALDCEYISKMVGYLLEHPEYDWVACDNMRCNNGLQIYYDTFPRGIDPEKILADYILHRVANAIWLYVIKRRYFFQCISLDSFYIDRYCAQEAQIAMPLFVGGGKLAYIREPLYQYKLYDTQIHKSVWHTYVEKRTHFIFLLNAHAETVKNLSLNNDKKMYYYRLIQLAMIRHILSAALGEVEAESDTRTWIQGLIQVSNDSIEPAPNIQPNQIRHPYLLLCALINVITGEQPKVLPPYNRVIAWGVLGNIAQKNITAFNGTPFEPSVLWDKAGDGITVKKPDVTSLHKDDLVFIVPIRIGVISSIRKSLADAGHTNLITYDEAMTQLSMREYPDFYDGSRRFVPKGSIEKTLLEWVKELEVKAANCVVSDM